MCYRGKETCHVIISSTKGQKPSAWLQSSMLTGVALATSCSAGMLEVTTGRKGVLSPSRMWRFNSTEPRVNTKWAVSLASLLSSWRSRSVQQRKRPVGRLAGRGKPFLICAPRLFDPQAATARCQSSVHFPQAKWTSVKIIRLIQVIWQTPPVSGFGRR